MHIYVHELGSSLGIMCLVAFGLFYPCLVGVMLSEAPSCL
jgi:hypothetical protein